MQEEVEGKAITLILSGARLTGNVLRQAVGKFLRSQEGKGMIFKRAGQLKTGRQSIRSLRRHGEGLTDIDVNDKTMRGFKRIARKYGIEYSIKKVTGAEKPTYHVYFKAKDKDLMTKAMEEFAGKTVRLTKKGKGKPSVIRKLRDFMEKVASLPRSTVRNRELVR